MPTLKQEITNRGIQGTIPSPNEDTPIQDLDGAALLELQAVFGMAIQSNPQLVRLVNQTAPVLFATLLFSVMEAYEIDPNDPDAVTPTRDVFEAEAEAIGMIRSVAAAMGKAYGDLAVHPTDAEIDQDTDLEPVQ